METLRAKYSEGELDEEIEIPGYSQYLGSLKHVYTTAFGDFDTDPYSLGDGS